MRFSILLSVKERDSRLIMVKSTDLSWAVRKKGMFPAGAVRHVLLVLHLVTSGFVRGAVYCVTRCAGYPYWDSRLPNWVKENRICVAAFSIKCL